MIFAAQGAESLDYKIIVAAFAIVVLAFKVVLDVLKWRRESGQPQQDPTLSKILESLTDIKDTLNKEHPLTGQKLIYLPGGLDQKLEMIRDVRAQTGAILKIIDDWSSRGGPTNPGG